LLKTKYTFTIDKFGLRYLFKYIFKFIVHGREYIRHFLFGDDGAWYTILLLAKQYHKSYDIGVTESYLNTVKTIMKIKLNRVQI